MDEKQETKRRERERLFDEVLSPFSPLDPPLSPLVTFFASLQISDPEPALMPGVTLLSPAHRKARHLSPLTDQSGTVARLPGERVYDCYLAAD